MQRELQEVTFDYAELLSANGGDAESAKKQADEIHKLRFVKDTRGMVKFVHRDTGEHYYQAPGNLWYKEKSEA